MSDIRKRIGAKGTTYQVRYPSKAAKSGYAYKTFSTRKEALYREDAGARLVNAPTGGEIRTIAQGIQKWLDICEKEGRNGREPVTSGQNQTDGTHRIDGREQISAVRPGVFRLIFTTRYTLDNYEYRAAIVNKYPWSKELRELTKPDIIEFRSWLLETYSRDVAHKVLTSFHSMILEMVSRAILLHDIAAGVCVGATSRYDEPIDIPSEKEIQALLSASDRLANSRNAQVQRTWEKYPPMLYLAVDSGMRPQEYPVLLHSL